MGPVGLEPTTYGLKGHCLGRWWLLMVVYSVGIAHVASLRVMVAECLNGPFVYWSCTGPNVLLPPVSARMWYRKMRQLGSRN